METLNLEQFTGTENYYKHDLSGLLYTDGVAYLAEKVGAYWLLDLIGSWQPTVLKKIRASNDRNFQAWTLSKTKEGYRMNCTNGNDGYLIHQDIPYTDFPENLMPFDIWAIDGVMLLKSEY